MKKIALFLCVVVLAAGVFACKGGGKYGEVISVMEKYIDAMEKYAAAIGKVKTADDVVAALNDATEAVKPLVPKLKELGTKFPEIKNMENPPVELKPLDARMKALMDKMGASMGKVMEFAQDPKVQAAQQKFAELMAESK